MAVPETSAAAPAGRPAATEPSRWERWWVAGLIGAYLAGRAVVWARADVFVAGDSVSYAPRGDAALDHAPLVSLVGDAPRPWGVPLLYALVPTDVARVGLQFVLGSFAWVLLAWVLWRRMVTPLGRACVVVAVLTLALTTSVTSWDYMILSESLSITLGVLTLALLLLVVDSRSWAVLVAFAASGVWWMFTRPDVLVFIGPMVAALAIVAWRVRACRWHCLGAALALVAGLGWFAATAASVDRSMAAVSTTGESQTRETLLYRLYLQILPDPALRSIYEDELGMPVCPAAAQVSTNPWDILAFHAAYRSCPELARWADGRGSTAAFRFALTSPGQYGRLVGETLPDQLSGNVFQYGRSVTVLPPPVQRAIFPSASATVPWLAAALAAAVIACALTGAHRRRGWLVVAGAVAVATALAGVGLTVLFSAGAYSRYGIQEAVALRLGVIFLLAAALDLVPARVGHPLWTTGRRQP